MIHFKVLTDCIQDKNRNLKEVNGLNSVDKR